MRIAIINCNAYEFDENSLNGALGGSETWVIELSNELQKLGNEIIVFCACQTHEANNGVKYINLQEMIPNLATEKYDAVIISRFVFDIIEFIENNDTTKNIYVQAHDDSLIIQNPMAIDNPRVKAVVSLSQWHKMYLNMPHNARPITLDKIAIIPNGVNPSFIPNNNDKERDNSILWSSSPARGLNILVNYIAPLVRKRFPDFTVRVCGYNDNLSLIEGMNDEIMQGHVKILGNLNKKELYEEMAKHKCWFYPQTFHETFCITALEQAINEVDLIMPFQNGLAHTFAPFERDVAMVNYFDRDIPQFTRAIKEANSRICLSLEHYDNNKELRDKIKEYLLKYYKWSDVANMWMDLINATKE